MNVATFAQRQAEGRESRTLAVVDGRTVTYGELVDGAARVSTGLRKLGIEPGDRVAVMMSTRAEFLFAWFGILGVGAIEVPIHDLARGPGISYILETTGARAFIVDDEHVEFIADYIGGCDALERVIVAGESPG